MVYPVIYNVLYIPGGAGFPPSTELNIVEASWSHYHVLAIQRQKEPDGNEPDIGRQGHWNASGERDRREETNLWGSPGICSYIVT